MELFIIILFGAAILGLGLYYLVKSAVKAALKEYFADKDRP